jgi:hypothetical protein
LSGVNVTAGQEVLKCWRYFKHFQMERSRRNNLRNI